MQSVLALAAEFAAAAAGDDTERGTNVAFVSIPDAEIARDRINESLAGSDCAGLVRAWAWRLESSTGEALTKSGVETDVEVRLRPHVARRSSPSSDG